MILENIARWASSHHERRDGSGYPQHVSEQAFSIEMDIVAFADIISSLAEVRPYRTGMNAEDIRSYLALQVPEKLNERVYVVIRDHMQDLFILWQDYVRMHGSCEYAKTVV